MSVAQWVPIRCFCCGAEVPSTELSKAQQEGEVVVACAECREPRPDLPCMMCGGPGASRATKLCAGCCYGND